jgi:hypothetical protein
VVSPLRLGYRSYVLVSGAMAHEPLPRQPLGYADIHIRLSGYEGGEDGGTFQVWVEGETPAGTMRPDDASRCSFDPGRFWNNPAAGIGGLVGLLERRRLEEPQLYELGGLLAGLALPEGPVRSLFDRSLAGLKPGQGLRLRLQVDAEPLLRLPWEYLALPEASGAPQPTDFLALRREVSIVRTDTVQAAARDLPQRGHAALVGVLSTPVDQPELDVAKDRRYLEAAVAALTHAAGGEAVRLRWCEQPATREALIRVLAGGADIFHFAGHGRFSAATHIGSILLETDRSETDEYPSSMLAQLLRDSGIRLAVLGACDTGRRGGEDAWSGVAPALTGQRIPAVIGNQFTIEDQNAGLLAANAYPLLFAGFTIDEALYEVRQAIFQRSGLAHRDWGAPVLYLRDADGVLFPVPSGQAAEGAVGPFVRVANSFGHVLGKVVDVDVGEMSAGRLEVRDQVDVVGQGGTFTAVRIERLGSHGGRPDETSPPPGD